MATIRVDYFGMEGSGKNVTAAKQDAGRKIEQALEGDYTPRVLTHRGYAMLVYREAKHGWCLALIAEPGCVREGLVSSGSGHDLAGAMIEAQERLAQLGWQDTDGLTPPPFLKNHRARREFETWAEFQLRFQKGLRKGLSRDDAHSYAGRNPTRPELWQEEEKQGSEVA